MARLPFEMAGMQGLAAVPKHEAPVAAAQTWVRGAVLIQNGSGELEEGGANPTAIVGVALAKHPPTNTPEGEGYHIPARENIEFIASVDDSAAIDTGAIAAGDLYTAYGITEDGSGVWYIDKNKTAAADVRVRITGFKDAVGTVQGRVRVQFLPIVDLAGTPTAVTVFAGN